MPVALGHHQEKFDFAFRQVGPQRSPNDSTMILVAHGRRNWSTFVGDQLDLRTAPLHVRRFKEGMLAGPQLLAAKSPGGSDAARYTVLGARV